MRRAYFGIEGKAYNDFPYEFRLNARRQRWRQQPHLHQPHRHLDHDADRRSRRTATSTSTAAGCAIGSIEPAGEGDPLLNKMVITYIGIPNWHFNVGVIEPSFMMEGTTSSANLIWMERPEIENIAADSFRRRRQPPRHRNGLATRPTPSGRATTSPSTSPSPAARPARAAGHGNGGDEQTPDPGPRRRPLLERRHLQLPGRHQHRLGALQRQLRPAAAPDAALPRPSGNPR